MQNKEGKEGRGRATRPPIHIFGYATGMTSYLDRFDVCTIGIIFRHMVTFGADFTSYFVRFLPSKTENIATQTRKINLFYHVI